MPHKLGGMPRIEAPTVAEHNAMRRRQVIEAAADELRDGGLAGFTPAAVAKRAGLARSSMYQYYPSTDALLGAAITTLLQRSRDRAIAAVDTADTPAARVSAYIRAAIADARDGHSAVSYTHFESSMISGLASGTPGLLATTTGGKQYGTTASACVTRGLPLSLIHI